MIFPQKGPFKLKTASSLNSFLVWGISLKRKYVFKTVNEITNVFDFTKSDYSACTPSIIRLEDDEFLEQYYDLLGDLKEYNKC